MSFHSTIPASNALTPAAAIWKMDNDRLVYLLGTSHGSKQYVEAAKQLVEQVRPNAVFVELDLCRFDPTRFSSTTITPKIPSHSHHYLRKNEVDLLLKKRPLSLSESIKFSAVRLLSFPPSMITKQKISDGDSAVERWSCEMRTAIYAGRNQGADIILGDRDYSVTQQRFRRALAIDDWTNIWYFLALAEDQVMNNENDEIGRFRLQHKLLTEDRREAQSFWSQWQSLAPALFQVLTTERDAYMATALHDAGDYKVICAIVGMGHVDGVEQNLFEEGWKPIGSWRDKSEIQ